MLVDGAHLFKTHQLPNFMLPNLQYCLEGARGQGVGVWGGGGRKEGEGVLLKNQDVVWTPARQGSSRQVMGLDSNSVCWLWG